MWPGCGDACVPVFQNGEAGGALGERIDAYIAIWVFVAIECLFEWAITPGDQRGGFNFIAAEPVFWIVPGKRPAHDIEAFVDH